MAPMLLILTQRMTLTVQTNYMRGVEFNGRASSYEVGATS